LVTVGEEFRLYIPPPSPITPNKIAEFPEKVQLCTVGKEPSMYIPPPLTFVPLVIVNPSSTATESTPIAVTTEPLAPPSIMLRP